MVVSIVCMKHYICVTIKYSVYCSAICRMELGLMKNKIYSFSKELFYDISVTFFLRPSLVENRSLRP
jgi:hypothetical protein